MIRKEDRRRFLLFIDRVKMVPSGCWVWQGRTAWTTYGGKKVSAHRLAWRLFYGKDPINRRVERRCGDAMCVRPDHLYEAGERQEREHSEKFLANDGDVLVGMLEEKTISEVSRDLGVPIVFVEGIVSRLRERDRHVAAEAYLAGSKIKDLATRFGVSLRVMNRWLADHKLRRPSTTENSLETIYGAYSSR